MKKAYTTICIANHKGGVGKTTTAVTLATGLAGLRYPTILIDTDPQGHVAQFLGLQSDQTLFNWLVTGNTYPFHLHPTYNIEIILSDSATVDLETLIRVSDRYPIVCIKNKLSQLLTGYPKNTVVIIDTAPTLSTVQVASLVAADWLLIPTSPEYAAEIGVAALVQTAQQLRAAGHNPNLLGILPTLVDSRSKEHKELIRELHVAFPGLVLPPVRRLIALAEAPRAGVPIWDYNQRAAEDYAAVLKEIVKRGL